MLVLVLVHGGRRGVVAQHEVHAEGVHVEPRQVRKVVHREVRKVVQRQGDHLLVGIVLVGRLWYR